MSPIKVNVISQRHFSRLLSVVVVVTAVTNNATISTTYNNANKNSSVFKKNMN